MSDKNSSISPRLYAAMDLAIHLHGRELRKASPVPYLAHLFNTCALVLQDGGDEDEGIAALLHDCLEDKPEQVTPDLLRSRFGEKVLRIVEISTDTPADYAGGGKPPWEERKRAYLERARDEDPALLRVTVADKIDNARAILFDHDHQGQKVWERFNAPRERILWYYRASVNAYRAAGFQGPLLDELERLVAELERLP